MPRYRMSVTVECADGTEHSDEIDVTAATASDAIDAESMSHDFSTAEWLSERNDVVRLAFEVRKLA